MFLARVVLDQSRLSCHIHRVCRDCHITQLNHHINITIPSTPVSHQRHLCHNYHVTQLYHHINIIIASTPLSHQHQHYINTIYAITVTSLNDIIISTSLSLSYQRQHHINAIFAITITPLSNSGHEGKDTDVDQLIKKLSKSKKKRVTARQTVCLLYTSPSPRDRQKSRMPSSA